MSMLHWNKVDTTLYQRCATLFRRLATLLRCSFNVGHRFCINVVLLWKSDVRFCFIFNVGSTLFQHWSTTLKQRWNVCWEAYLSAQMLSRFCRGPPRPACPHGRLRLYRLTRIHRHYLFATIAHTGLLIQTYHLFPL